MTGTLDRLRRKRREADTDAATHRAGYLAWRDRLTSFGKAPAGSRVLDIGTGDRAPLALQFAADRAVVDAVDLRPVQLGRNRPRMWWRLLRQDGLRSASRTIVIDLIHTRRYWRRLAALAGGALPTDRVYLVQADATRLPLPDGQFDIVVSSAVWEHLPDVAAATREVARVMASDGIAVIQIAPFPSLQGGHYPEWHSTEPRPRLLRPWEHLRSDAAPQPVYLNEWRESQYVATIGSLFDDVGWEAPTPEGREYLTAETHAELGDYTERDLLTSSITAWCRGPRSTLLRNAGRGPAGRRSDDDGSGAD